MPRPAPAHPLCLQAKPRGGSRNGLSQLKGFAASKAQQLASGLAGHLSRMPVQLVISVHRFQGGLMLWMPPPPSDRWVTLSTTSVPDPVPDHNPVPDPVPHPVPEHNPVPDPNLQDVAVLQRPPPNQHECQAGGGQPRAALQRRAGPGQLLHTAQAAPGPAEVGGMQPVHTTY